MMYSTYPASPLTFDNVFEVVKTVRSWRDLAAEYCFSGQVSQV